MGGKTSTSTSQVSIPPEVLARYNSVNATAEQTAQQPFQQYSTNPNAFVAPITPTQQAGITNTNSAAGMAQPYYQTGTGFALAGAQPVNANPLDTSTYMNPYLQTVLGSTEALVNQQNQQAMSGQTGNAMSQGYFGGDRAGIAAAVLQGQQMLQGGQLYSGIASDAYNQALQAAQQQQGVNLAAQQANRAALQQTGQSLAELGTGAQGAALSGAQAQLGAGQVEQQTQQAGLTALYNQFLQQESYPFQVAQFLANIAEGTGALSGSTTTTTQPQSIFSDERLKEDIEPIGKGFDGANIIRFRYRGDPTTRIGMSAQEVERDHPEAVSEHGGFKAVDYGAATDDAARRGFALAANDNEGDRRARQAGGMSGWGLYPSGVNPMSVAELLQAQAQMYGPGFGGAGLYGGSPSGMPHGGSSYVPQASLPVGQLQIAHPPAAPQSSALHDIAQLGDTAREVKGDVSGAKSAGNDILNWWTKRGTTPGGGPGSAEGSDVPFASGGLAIVGQDDDDGAAGFGGLLADPQNALGLLPRLLMRSGRAFGGGDPSDPTNDDPYRPQGAALDIPTADTQHPKLAVAQPPKQSGDSTLGDILKIAQTAAMFAGARHGGRVGYASGGEPDSSAIADLASDDPLLSGLLTRTLHPPAAGFARAAPPPAESAAAGPAGPAGGGPAPGAPAGGFMGASPPRTISEAAAAPSSSLPAGFAGIFKAEGTGQNPMSSAHGPGQFIDSTFKRMFRKLFPERAAGMSDSDILTLRKTPEGDKLSMAMIPALDAENSSALRAAGFADTPANRHLAWVLGSSGAKKVLGADPSTPLVDLVGQKAVGANKRIMAGKTAGDFINWAAKGMNKGGRAGFADGGDIGLVAGPDDTTVGGFDPAVIEQAKRNRDAAAAGEPSTPAAQAAVAAPAGGGGFGNAAPPTDWGLTHAELNATQEQDRLRQMAEDQSPSGGHRSFMDTLRSPSGFLPILAGIASAGAVPTVHPLVALAAGLGGWGNAYQAQRQYAMQNAQKAAEIGAVGLGEEAGAQTARASVLSTQTEVLNRAQAIFEGQWRQMTGPDGTPVYTNAAGEMLTPQQYMARRNQFLLDAMGRMGGGGGSTGPLGALAGTTGLTQGGGGPPVTGAAQGADSPAGPAGVGVVDSGPAGGGADAGRVSQHGVLAAGPGAGAVHPAAGPGGGGGQPAAAAVAKPGRTFAQRLTRGDYGQLPVARPTPSYEGLAPGSNPVALRAKATNEQAWGQLDQANADRKLADQIESGEAQAVDTNGRPDMRFVDLQQQRQRYDQANQAAMQEQGRTVEAAHQWIARAGQTEQALRQADDIYANLNSNVNSPEWAHLVGRIRSIPMMDGFTPDSWKEFQTHVERGEKVQALQQINQVVGGLGHAPGAGLHVTGLATPSPGQSPGTRYSIVHQQWEQYLRDQQYMNDVANHGGTILNWAKFNNDWAHDHPPEAFADEATKQIGPSYFAGMLPQEKAAHPFVPKTQAELNALPAGVPVYWKGKVQWTQ